MPLAGEATPNLDVEVAPVVEGFDLPVVLQVDVSGLDLFFEFGEARHHSAVIESSRLRVMDPQPAPNLTGWSAPYWRRDHSDCLVLHDLPLSRRLLNEATDEFNMRYPYGADHGTWRQVVAERGAPSLARHPSVTDASGHLRISAAAHLAQPCGFASVQV